MTPNSTWDSRVSAKDKANLQMWLPFPRGTVSLTETGRLLLLRHVIYLLLFSAWHLPRHTEHLPYDAGVVVLLLWFPGTEEDLKLCKFLQAGVGRGGGDFPVVLPRLNVQRHRSFGRLGAQTTVFPSAN